MIEAYQIGMKLDMTSNILPMLQKLTKEFDALTVAVKATQAALDTVGKGFRAFGTVGRQVDRLTTKLDRMNLAGAAGMAKFDAATQAALAANKQLTAVLTQNAQLAAQMGRYAGGGGAGAGGGGRPPAGGAGAGAHGHDFMLAGIAASMVGGAMIGFYKEAITKGLSIGHLQAVLGADDRISQAQIKAATDTAFATARSVPGTTAAGNLGAILDLKQVTGTLDASVAALPAFAKLQTILQAMDRKQGGEGDAVFAASKAMEILGRMVVPDPAHPGQHMVDAAGLTEAIDQLARVVVGTGRQEGAAVDPAAYLAFAKQARVGGMALDDQALFRDLPALLMVLGGSRTGTGEAATYQQFINGTMTEITSEMMKAHHILDPRATWKHGRVLDMNKYMVGADLFQKDPVEWARKILIPELNKEGITDPVAQAQAVAMFSGKQTTAGFLGEIVRNIPAIDKEATNISHTRPGAVTEHDPQQSLRNFKASWDTFLSALGSSPALDVATSGLDKLTGSLNKFSAWSRYNPVPAGYALDVVGALGGIGLALGALSTAVYLFGPALRVIGSVGGGLTKLGRAVEYVGASGFAVLERMGLLRLALADLLAPLGFLLTVLHPTSTQTQGQENKQLGGPLHERFPNLVAKPGDPNYAYGEHTDAPHVETPWHLPPDAAERRRGWLEAPHVESPSNGWSRPERQADVRPEVEIKQDSQVSLAHMIAVALAEAIKGLSITVDGETLGRLMDRRDNRAASAPPTTAGTPDVRLPGIQYPALGY